MANELHEVLRNLFVSELYRCEMPANYTNRVVDEFDWADMAERLKAHVEEV